MSVEFHTRILPAPDPLALEGAALFLDLDGTLAPIAARPQDVVPDVLRSERLDRLSKATGGRLAVISGRSLEDIDRILDARVPVVAAVHGLVRREADGVVHRKPPHPALYVARARFCALAARDPGLIVEDKGLSVAIHYRQSPAYGAEAAMLARDLAAETGLDLQRGDMVEELRTPGPDKGDSVRTLMAMKPFTGARPVFVGDDDTDEDGFAAALALGGFGVLVGPERATRASFRLRDVAAAAAWLDGAR